MTAPKTIRLSNSMRMALWRLNAGDGRIVPLQGGFWLPGDIADNVPLDGNVWFERAKNEFLCRVVTSTVDALRARGLLSPGEPGYDKRPPEYALKIHYLTELGRRYGHNEKESRS